MTPKELEGLVKLALEEARKLGADQAEVGASHDKGLSATARLGDVENLEYTSDRGIGITVYKDFQPRNPERQGGQPFSTTIFKVLV